MRYLSAEIEKTLMTWKKWFFFSYYQKVEESYGKKMAT